MAQTIKLKRSNTSGTKPSTSSLALGEIALNTKDGLFFLRRHVDGTDGNDTIRAYTPEYLTEYDSQIDVTVTVDTKTAAHPQYGNGSSNGFLLDGLEGPALVLVPGNTYRFDQSDSSNSGHPLRFYYESDKTTSFTTGVTTNGTAGSSGAYTQIAVTTSTPQVLYYQCSSHSLMGSGAFSIAGTIVEDQLAADSVTSAKIAANAVTSSEIAANAITSSEIAANSVDSAEIASNAITSAHISSGVVIEADVADNAVTSAKIAKNAVGTSEIAANSVGTSEIASNAITTALIAANQVGISELNVTDGTSGQALTTDGSGTLSFSTVASSLAGASDTNISSPSSGQVLVYDGTDSFDNVSISGDATLSNTGALTIAANAIEASMIAANAVGSSEIAGNSVGIDELNVSDGTSGQVLTTDGAGTLSFSTVSGGGGSQNLFSTIAVSGQSDIVADATTDTLTVAAGSGISLTTNASTDTLTITATGGGLSANAVTSAYLASNAVLARHIAANAVGSSEIAANAIGSSELASSGVTAGTYGSSTASPQLTVDADGRITSVTNTTISSSGGGGYGFNQQVDLDELTGDGSTVTFDTGVTILSENNTIVFIDGVYQEKGTYSTNGSEITFSTAPPNGTSVEIMHFHQVTTGGGFAHNEFDGDGSTTGFTLSTTPSAETDLIVFIDGVYQNRDSFTISGTTLTFDTAPGNGTKIIAYTISGVITGKSNITNTFNGDDSTTDFTLTLNPNDENNTNVFVGGVYQPKSTYSVSGTTLSFSEAPPTGTGNIEVIISQITTTTQLGVNALDGQTFNGDFELTGELTSGEFIGDLRGAVLFKAQAGEALSKGDVVYISGISGNTTVVSKADADDSAKMPAFGVAAAAASINTPVDVYTQGTLSSIDTSSFTVGDELFVSTTAGALTSTAPTGETSKIQKIAKVTRSDATAGSIFITGAGRTNAVPNLDDGDIFIGNGSNQAVTASLDTKIESYLDGGTSTPTLASLNVTTTTTDDSVTITTTEDSSAAAPVVTLKRNSASPADADYLGQIKFKGENDADQEVVYGKITGKIGDNTDTTEDGIIEFANIKDGTQTITVRLKSDEMQLLNSTGLNVAGTTVLSGLTYPTSDGTTGQVLQTNGSGTLSFGTISGYTDSDVETYLNTSAIYTDPTNDRLGIGTSNPSYLLDVESASGTDNVLNVRNPSTSWGEYALARFQTDTKDQRFIDLGYYRGLSEPERAFIINGQSSNRLFTILESTGYVGIGTDSPSHGLTVSDDVNSGNASMRRITIKSATHGVNSGFRFDSESTNGTARAGGYYFQPGDTDATTYLGLSATDAAYQMVINREGHVSIGTDTPIPFAGTGVSSLTMNSTSTTVSGGITYSANGTAKAYHYWENNHLLTQAASGQGLKFYTNLTNTAIDINSSGEIGLNTSPVSNVVTTIQRPYSSGDRVLVISNGSNDVGASYDTVVINQYDVPTIRLIETQFDVQSTWSCGNENSNRTVIGSTGPLAFCSGRAADTAGYSNSGERMHLSTDGTVCINRTSIFGTGNTTSMIVTGKSASCAYWTAPNTANYDIHTFFNGGLGIIGTIRQNSSLNGVAYNTSSDYRLKENVSYDWDATTRLKQLKPCRFNWISDETNTLEDGFLAHEVATAVPNAVTGEKDAMIPAVLYEETDQEVIDGTAQVGDIKEEEKINPQQVDHSKLVPLLVKTIQELEARITELENA